ncbi:MAG TPA: hypothetical protein VFZ21_12210 [Gemmatimonadaceae bacterium]|nr:hypothetical protein [Gemmatimonadaceae bacterium]
MATKGRVIRIRASGAAVAFVDEATTDTGDGLTYQITNPAKRVWSPTAAITVEVDGAAAPAHTVNRLAGTITFAADPLGVVTVSGSYLPMTTVARANAYSFSRKSVLAEDPEFGDIDVTREVMQHTCSGSLRRWWVDDAFLDVLEAGLPIVIERADDNGATPRWRAWALLTERAHEVAAGGFQAEPITWEGTPDVDDRSCAFL